MKTIRFVRLCVEDGQLIGLSSEGVLYHWRDEDSCSGRRVVSAGWEPFAEAPRDVLQLVVCDQGLVALTATNHVYCYSCAGEGAVWTEMVRRSAVRLSQAEADAAHEKHVASLPDSSGRRLAESSYGASRVTWPPATPFKVS